MKATGTILPDLDILVNTLFKQDIVIITVYIKILLIF